MKDKSFLTQRGYDTLLKELRDLRDDKLPAVLLRLKDAIGQGDISENSEYETAMAEKDLIEARVTKLESLLENVEIITEGKKSDEIRYGSKVAFETEKGKIYNISIVGSGEVDINNNDISFQSPVGHALEGKKKGDIVKVRAPRGKYTITVLEVN